MVGEGPAVPITTLAGIQSLTDLLLELPLPTPLPGITRHQSLLSHLRDSEEARRLLNTKESILVSQLTEALGFACIDHIEIKDGYYDGESHSGGISQLVQYLLGKNPSLFKGSVNGFQTLSDDHHVSPSNSLHPQQHAFNASAVSPCQPSNTQADSEHYFPLESPSTPQNSRILQNTNLNELSKSLVTCSPYTNTKALSQPSTFLNHNTISQGNTDLLTQGLQESPTKNNASLVNQQTISTPLVDSLSSENHANEVDLPSVITKLSERTENSVVDSVQVVNNTVQNNSSSTSVLNNSCKISSSSLSSSSSTTTTTTTSTSKPASKTTSKPANITDTLKSPLVPLVDCMKNSTFDQVVTNSLLENSKPETCAKENKNCRIESKSKTAVQQSAASSSEHKETDKVASRKNKERESKKETPLKTATTSEEKKMFTVEPVIVLPKLSLEDQLLAQKSVRQFFRKSRRAGSSPEPVKNKVSENNHQSSYKESGDSKSPSRQRSQNKYFRNNRNVDSGKQKGSKRSLETSPEKENNSPSSDQKRKKRRISSQATYAESGSSENENEDSDDSYRAESPSEQVQSAPKKQLKQKKAKKKLAPEPLSGEDLMDSDSYQNFSRLVDVIFDSMEDIDFSAVADEDAEDCAKEALIPLHQLQKLSCESAKLKRLHAMNQFPSERLSRLLIILERNVTDGAKLLPVQLMEEQDEEEARLWLELTMERVMRSADAALTALYIMTSPKMPEKVFIEEVIERIVIFLKYQLLNTVFPIFDPAYRLDPKSKDGYAGSIKQKRAHASKVKSKSVLQLYNKLHEGVSLLAELMEVQMFKDTIILHVSTLGVSPFFVEGISELQLNALRLVTTIFARYDKHRDLILEDILASIARLPTSKQSLRNYRLNSEENIQMLTALVLQLIHSIVRLPEPEVKTDFLLNDEKAKTPENKEKPIIDKDVLIMTSYEAAMKTEVSFLSVFLKKCGLKNEDMDYKPLFENFVQDLLTNVNKPEWPASELLLSVLGRLVVQNFSSKSMEVTLRTVSLDYLGVVAARFRKDAVSSQDRKDKLNDVIQRIVAENNDVEVSSSKNKMKNKK